MGNYDIIVTNMAKIINKIYISPINKIYISPKKNQKKK